MLNDYIRLGQRVELRAVTRVKLNGEEPNPKVYSSKVYDILSDERLEILMPYEQTKLVLLPVDADYELFFYGENGLYQCVAKIVDRYKSNNMYILVVELLTNLRKYQRREYYRFSCALDMDSRVLEEGEMESVEKDKHWVPGLPLKRSIIVDISGGGIRFVSDFKYEKGCLIYCRYNLWKNGEQKTYEVAGKVLEVKPVEKRKGSFEHRVQYQNIDKNTREEIIRYIFEEERKNQKLKQDK